MVLQKSITIPPEIHENFVNSQKLLTRVVTTKCCTEASNWQWIIC